MIERERIDVSNASNVNDAGTARAASERDIAYFNALDPHAVTSSKPWEIEIVSKYLRRVALVLVIVIMAAHMPSPS